MRTIAGMLLLLALAGTADAQITTPRKLSATPDRFATLEEQLINRLRATGQDQRDYLRFVVEQVRDGKLDVKLVVVVQRYAMQRNPRYPFPFFERALKYEAGKRGVALPAASHFVTSASN